MMIDGTVLHPWARPGPWGHPWGHRRALRHVAQEVGRKGPAAAVALRIHPRSTDHSTHLGSGRQLPEDTPTQSDPIGATPCVKALSPGPLQCTAAAPPAIGSHKVLKLDEV